MTISQQIVVVYALAYFLVLSALIVAISIYTLRSLKDIDDTIPGHDSTLLLRFLVLVHVFDLLRLANLISVVAVTVSATIHTFFFAFVRSHIPLLVLIVALWVLSALANSLLMDLKKCSQKGIRSYHL